MAIETGKPDTLQLVYNILHQDPEERLFPLAQKENIGIIARVPLERGILSGRFTDRADFTDDFRARAFPQEAFARVSAAVKKLDFLARGDAHNLAEAALRFVLSHPAVSAVIPGIRTMRQVEDNVAASGKPLPTEELDRLHELYKSDFRQIPFH